MSRRVQDADKRGNCRVFNQLKDKLALAWCNVGKAPDSFELELGVVDFSELHQGRNEVAVDGPLNRRALFEGEELAQGSSCDDQHQLVILLIAISDAHIGVQDSDDLLKFFMLYKKCSVRF